MEESSVLPERVEGWLNVLDVPASGDTSLADISNDWKAMFCVFRTYNRGLSHSVHEERYSSRKAARYSVVRIGGSRNDVLDNHSNSFNQPLSNTEDRKNKSFNNDTSFTNNSIDTSANMSFNQPLNNQSPSNDDSSSNRFVSLLTQIKGNLRRTKSTSKLYSKNKNQSPIENSLTSTSTTDRLKRTMSLSRLSRKFHKKSPHDLPKINKEAKDSSQDGRVPIINLTQLNHNTTISVVHQPYHLHHKTQHTHHHIFLVSNDKISRYYSCQSHQNMLSWMFYMKKSLEGALGKEHRKYKRLSVLVSEAKNLPKKHAYYCEIVLGDNKVHWRSSSVLCKDCLFWGEEFILSNSQRVCEESLILNVYQEDSKKKKKDVLIGTIEISIGKEDGHFNSEKWYNMKNVKGVKNSQGSKMPSVRVQVKSLSVSVAPLKASQPLLSHISQNYQPLIVQWEEVLTAKQKEELSTLLVRIFIATNQISPYLASIVLSELNKKDSQENTLRGNSMASKSLEAFVKVVCKQYLHTTLTPFLISLTNSDVSFDLEDTSTDLSIKQRDLNTACENIAHIIFTSSLPLKLKSVLSYLRSSMTPQHNDDVINNLVTSCFFLRLVCPAVWSPHLFGLFASMVTGAMATNLKMVAKALQVLANFSRFGGGKEEHLTFMNSFIDSHAPSLISFINHSLTSASDMGDGEEMSAYDIDLARDLSMLHQALKGVKLPPDLQTLVSNLDEASQRKSLHDSIEDLTDDKSVNGVLPYYTRQTRISAIKSGEAIQDEVPEDGRISGMFVEADRLVRSSYEALNSTPTPLKHHNNHQLLDDDSIDSATTFYSYNTNNNNYEVCSLNRQQLKNNKKTPLSFNNPAFGLKSFYSQNNINTALLDKDLRTKEENKETTYSTSIIITSNGLKKNASPSSFKRSITLPPTPPSLSIKTNPPFQQPTTHNGLSLYKTNSEKTPIDNTLLDEIHNELNSIIGNEDNSSESTCKTEVSRESITKVYDEFDGVVCGLFSSTSPITTSSHIQSKPNQAPNQLQSNQSQQQQQQKSSPQQSSLPQKQNALSQQQLQQQKSYPQQQHPAPLTGQGSMGTNSLVHYFEQTRKYNNKYSNSNKKNNSNNTYQKMTSVPVDTGSLDYHWKNLHNKTSNNEEENRVRQGEEPTKTRRQLMDKEWQVLQYKEAMEKMKKEHDLAAKEHERQMIMAQKKIDDLQKALREQEKKLLEKELREKELEIQADNKTDITPQSSPARQVKQSSIDSKPQNKTVIKTVPKVNKLIGRWPDPALSSRK